MNRVGAVLSIERIRLGLAAVSKNQILDEAGRLFAPFEHLAAPHIAASLVARERLGSTGLGHGVAIPHARLKEVRQSVAAFIRPSLATDFDSPDGKPVSEVLVVLVPEQASEDHLQLLAEAAALFGDRRFREHLRNQDTAAGVYQAFADWPPATA
jgi:PTS system nitrogen regulatory IIA component